MEKVNALKTKLQEIEIMREESSKRLRILETKKQRQIREIENRFFKLEEEVVNPITNFEIQVYNGLIDSFEDLVLQEIDKKRSDCEYCLSDEVNTYRNQLVQVEIFPKELIARLDQVLAGKKTMEDIAYKLGDIKEKYIKPLP
ncbi:MAG: hypothetical protein EU530_05445 [Promethearchaeota archaeon]|nr:MAG: hypothetical protein EU530_05445 [Candidatus Lokiarchaeota archaeon]